MRLYRPLLSLCSLILILVTSCKKESTVIVFTPELPFYIDSVVEITELPKAQTEQNRMGAQFPQSDFTPVGFYLPANATVKLIVEQIDGSRLPELMIGTYSRGYTEADPFWQNETNVRFVQLVKGENNIVDQGQGGLLYLRFTNDAAQKSKVRVRFVSGMKAVPFFKKGITTQEQWLTMLDSLNDVPDVQMLGDKTIIVVGLDKAKTYKNEDVQKLLTLTDKVVAFENEINGLDNSTALHKAGSHRYLLVQHQHPDYYFYAFFHRTAFEANSIRHILVPELVLTDGWGLYHEIGHMFQPAWSWSALGEVTNNIYSLYVERKLGAQSRMVKDGVWNRLPAYFTLPDAKRNFNGDNIDVFMRLCMFRQLELAYGDEYEIQFHKQYRQDRPNVTLLDDAAKMRYYMLTACKISGKNLSSFFKKWALPVNASVYTEIGSLGLPAPQTDLTLLKEN